MAELGNETTDETSALKKRVAELENVVFELKKPTVDRFLPRLTPILTILGGIQALLIAFGLGFGYLGVSNILSVKNEADKVKEIVRTTESIYAGATAQIESLKVAQHIGKAIIESAKSTKYHIDSTKQSIDNTYAEAISLQNIFESKLQSTLAQTQQEREKLKLSVDRELSILRKKISTTDSNVVNLAKVFSRAAVQGKNSGSINASQAVFLFFLSSVIYETSGLPVDNEGLFYYNLAINLMNIGKFDLAITAFNESLIRQPKLSGDKKSQIGKHIAICQNKIDERKKMMSQQTKPLTDINDYIDFNNKLSMSILQALTEVGIFEQEKTNEILKRAELDNN